MLPERFLVNVKLAKAAGGNGEADDSLHSSVGDAEGMRIPRSCNSDTYF